MMVQETIVEIEKIVMEEEEVGGTRGLHMVKEEDSGRNDDESEDEANDNRFQLSFGRQCHRRGNHEEIFGKLKFTMPKFVAEPSMRNFSG